MSPGQEDIDASLEELSELAKTAGAVTVGKVVQSRDQVHPGTYVGKGKIDEIKSLLWELDATGIICDDELSPAQMKNLQDELDAKVMDRTLVILDIFAARASTSEGKIQVELAQLKYRQTRLAGFGTAMSRLGGGIGTRGPGEKKLEMDRRLIKNRIALLNRELKSVKQHREVTREKRAKSRIPVAAIVGYTNAGKSTLLNALTGADILAEDKLFATLDPTTRSLKLPSGQEILLTDTVGFIRKLPHHLVDVLDPSEDFNVVLFQQMAKEAMEGIYQRGHIPIVVGGTGFYIQALLYDIDFTENNADTAYREELEALAKNQGAEYLHEMLKKVDPESAEQIHFHNVKRVIRALEYYQQTGQKISEHNEAEREKESAYNSAYFVLTDDRKILYDRIDKRVDLMMQEGLLEEVNALRLRGLKKESVAMQGLGYKELFGYFEGEYPLEEAVRIIKRDTRHFAKRQLTWFKREKDVTWIDRAVIGDDEEHILDFMIEELRKKQILV